MRFEFAPLPAVEELRECFELMEPEGRLFWRRRPTSHFPSEGAARAWNTRYAYRAAGYVNRNGYVQIIINSKSYLGHRIIWKMRNGIDPPGEIDHGNHDRIDNREENHSIVSPLENCRNMKLSSRNNSGVSGVGFMKSREKWRARIGNGESCLYLGLFPTMELAISARKEALKKLGFHENHGSAQ